MTLRTSAGRYARRGRIVRFGSFRAETGRCISGSPRLPARLLHWMASPAGWRWAKRLGGLAIVMSCVAFIVLDNFVLVEFRIASLGITTRLGWVIAATGAISYAAGRGSRLRR